MTLREWLASPVCLLGWLCEEVGEWLADKLHRLSERIAGPRKRCLDIGGEEQT